MAITKGSALRQLRDEAKRASPAYNHMFCGCRKTTKFGDDERVDNMFFMHTCDEIREERALLADDFNIGEFDVDDLAIFNPAYQMFLTQCVLDYGAELMF